MTLRSKFGFNTQRTLVALAMLFAACCAGAQVQPSAQRKKSAASTTYTTKQEAPKMPEAQGTPIDRLIAIVNGDLILDSDIDEEQRFETIQPFRAPAASDTRPQRDRAIERLINRDLILQQSKLQPGDEITDADVDKELENLRKNLPDCKTYHCESPDGWSKFLAAHGFTPQLMRERWRQRMQVLAFIEERFRMGIKIKPEEIKTYYDNTFLPQFTKQNATPPKLEAVSERIQEVLLQQQVSNLLNDWLKSLRAQGSVVVLHPGEVAP